MTDDDLEPDRAPRREHPILAGLVALLAVAVVVGGVVGGGALVATKALGLGDDQALDTSSSDSATLYLPDPTETDEPVDGGITLSGDPQTAAPKPDKPSKTKDAKPEPQISLNAGQTAVAAMEPIDLTGVYQSGEGAILRVQKFQNGSWSDFPVTAQVSGGTFSTYVQTGTPGATRFRMIDTDNGTTSNDVKVQIG